MAFRHRSLKIGHAIFSELGIIQLEVFSAGTALERLRIRQISSLVLCIVGWRFDPLHPIGDFGQRVFDRMACDFIAVV